MHWKNDKLEIAINDEADEFIEKPFKSPLHKFQNNLE